MNSLFQKNIFLEDQCLRQRPLGSYDEVVDKLTPGVKYRVP